MRRSRKGDMIGKIHAARQYEVTGNGNGDGTDESARRFINSEGAKSFLSLGLMHNTIPPGVSSRPKNK
jgi:hypothetical protein